MPSGSLHFKKITWAAQWRAYSEGSLRRNLKSGCGERLRGAVGGAVERRRHGIRGAGWGEGWSERAWP